MSALIYAGLVLALTLVVIAGIGGGVTWHKAVNGTASSGELAVGGIIVVGGIAAAGVVAFVASATATFLSQFG